MKGRLKDLLDLSRGRTCFIGLGQEGHGDDGFGPRLATALAERVSACGRSEGPRVECAGLAPERHLGALVEEGFEQVVFLDAVDFAGAPGDVLLADAARMLALYPQVSTHRLSLGLLARYLASRGVQAFLLGVQPSSLAPGRELSPEVAGALEALLALLAGPETRAERAPQPSAASAGERAGSSAGVNA
ncbi:MAG TPA: hydrogenase maturation protease [Anaeromyxobacteraceae bacterium]|nr:hydrogenase maturation protease [Anaeromyxobacteraceae bacterium]